MQEEVIRGERAPAPAASPWTTDADAEVEQLEAVKLSRMPSGAACVVCSCACLLAGDVEKVEAQRRSPLWGLRLGCYLGAGALQGVLGQGGGQSHLRLSLHSAQRSPERATRFL